MIRRATATLVAVLLVVLLAGLLQAEQAPGGETPGLLSQFYYEDVPVLTDAVTHDGVGEGIKSFGKVCLEEADALEKAGGQVLDAAGKPGLGGAMREKGLKLYGEGKQAEKLNRAGASWAQKVGRVLDVINIVSTVAKAAGHAVEGDLPGTVEVVVDEGSKKITTAGLATAGGLAGPLGSFAGAMAGEELHERVTRPAIQKEADDWRQARTAEQLRGESAKTPPHQRAAALDEERRLRAALERAGKPVAEGPAGLDILGRVAPQRLRAKGRKDVDHSSPSNRVILTSAFTLTFYNLGTLVPGYGKAVLNSTCTGSVCGSGGRESSLVCQGLFSGGPDGTFRLLCEKEAVTLRLLDGERVTGPDGLELTVENATAAFKDWPVKTP